MQVPDIIIMKKVVAHRRYLTFVKMTGPARAIQTAPLVTSPGSLKIGDHSKQRHVRRNWLSIVCHPGRSVEKGVGVVRIFWP